MDNLTVANEQIKKDIIERIAFDFGQHCGQGQVIRRALHERVYQSHNKNKVCGTIEEIINLRVGAEKARRVYEITSDEFHLFRSCRLESKANLLEDSLPNVVEDSLFDLLFGY
ncbi:hypothetical protein [Bacillus albus]|uniref:hypothetical protein n=1 Tax=Bacillus albus TaxID=2026189 RepID=UPI00102281E1|nr:hypothetical protein [Bacillus albus]